MDLSYKKEVVIFQLIRLIEEIEKEDELFSILEDKPYLCGNQTVLEYPFSVRIDLKIRLENIDIEN